MRRFWILLLLSACTHEPSEQSSPELPPSQSPAPSDSLVLDQALSKPVAALVHKAEAQLQQGQLNLARSQAERAYRMANDPRTSFLIARIAAAEGDYEDAEQWANRTLEAVEGAANRGLIWRFIARCRTQKGDAQGAQEALSHIP